MFKFNYKKEMAFVLDAYEQKEQEMHFILPRKAAYLISFSNYLFSPFQYSWLDKSRSKIYIQRKFLILQVCKNSQDDKHNFDQTYQKLQENNNHIHKQVLLWFINIEDFHMNETMTTTNLSWIILWQFHQSVLSHITSPAIWKHWILYQALLALYRVKQSNLFLKGCENKTEKISMTN